MARRSNMQMQLDAAIADASSVILKSMIGAMGKDTTILELVTAIRTTSFKDAFHAMTLAELAAAVSGDSAPAAPRGPGRPRKSISAAPASKATRKKRGKINTRTAEGRAELDAAIAAVLQANPAGLRSEEINSQVPGDTAQIRHSLHRMIAEGKVSKTGEKRATTYIWGGKAKSASKKKTATKRRSKKKAARKTTKKAATKAPTSV